MYTKMSVSIYLCTFMEQSISSRIIHMWWLRLIGSWKFLVSFAKELYKRDDILQKRPRILRSLLVEATPYRYVSMYVWKNPYLSVQTISIYTYIYIYILAYIYICIYAYSHRYLYLIIQIYVHKFMRCQYVYVYM